MEEINGFREIYQPFANFLQGNYYFAKLNVFRKGESRRTREETLRSLTVNFSFAAVCTEYGLAIDFKFGYITLASFILSQ